MKTLAKPCKDCPFSRGVAPGALGGSPVETYIGQAVGPFMLPCHKTCDFDDPEWKDKVGQTPQCAGAAIYRANIGVADLMPPGIARLPPDRANVFASHEEFIAHHLQVSPFVARGLLQIITPAELLAIQLARPTTKLVT